MNKQKWAFFVNRLENNGHNRSAKKIFFVLSFCFFPCFFFPSSDIIFFLDILSASVVFFNNLHDFIFIDI